MTHRLHRDCLLIMAGIAAASAQAAESDAILTLGEVSVNAAELGALSTQGIFTSVDRMGADLIENQSVDSAWELFMRMPGVQITEFNQGTTSGKLSFRGFNGEGEINAVKLLIDGIPSNTNDGNMPFIDMVMPLDIAYIETVKGTNDPRYGLYNIAGNATIVTHTSGDYRKLRLSTGSFSTQDVQAAIGIEGNRLSQHYFVGGRRTDGYREHADLDKQSFAGKWFLNLDENGAHRLGLILRDYSADAEEPGYLTLADSRADPRTTNAYNASDGGNRDMRTGSLHYEGEVGDVSLVARAYRNEYDDQRFVKFSAAVQQQERDTRERHTGLLTSATWRPAVDWAHQFALEVGANVENQDNTSLRYLTNERARATQTRDQDFSLDTLGAYVQTVVMPNAHWKIVPAWRVDKVDGDFTNNLQDTTAPINDYGLINQPKLSVVYLPFDDTSIYANWGRSFQIGVGAGSFLIPPRVANIDPSINTGMELGVKFAPHDGIESRLALWQQTATKEERRELNNPSGDSVAVGETRRRGIDAQLNARWTADFDTWVALALQESEIIKPDPNQPATQGKEIDHVPNWLLSTGARYQLTPAWALSAEVLGQDDYYLERTNTQPRYGRYVIANVGANWQVNRQLALDFQVRNLTDEYYEYVWYDGAQSLHSPADGRAYYLTANVRF